MQVSLPAELCAELGIKPGMRLDFTVRDGKLEAIKLNESPLAAIYTPERNAEELTIQRGCSTAVPDDFPQ